jgi:hypothetical protein
MTAASPADGVGVGRGEVPNAAAELPDFLNWTYG